jgi:hypothetical protein
MDRMRPMCSEENKQMSDGFPFSHDDDVEKCAILIDE